MKDKPEVLVVDDDPSISQLEQVYLKNDGYEVRAAADGLAAVEAFRKQPPDLILLDVTLPGLDGYEVLKMIRKSSSIPVIMVTARGETLTRCSVWSWARTIISSSPLRARSCWRG